MIIRKLRLQRGWSQEQLAELSGLSVRTIQRIERGHKPSLESLKCLAAVFETNVSELRPKPNMNDDVNFTKEEQTVIDQVRAIKGFYSHLCTYIFIITGYMPLRYLTFLVSNGKNVRWKNVWGENYRYEFKHL